jgi:hypothetical protein
LESKRLLPASAAGFKICGFGLEHRILATPSLSVDRIDLSARLIIG